MSKNNMKNGIYYNPETLRLYEIFIPHTFGHYCVIKTTDEKDANYPGISGIITCWMLKRDLARNYKELNLKYLGEI